jgi:UDP-N-acetylmuramoylalanine--D-glutamate ligase
MKQNFQNKKVAIVGYGVNNAELVPFLEKRGAKITICDKKESLLEDIERSRNTNSPIDAELRLGADYLKNLTDYDVIFRTPGLPYLTPEIQEAKKAGVIITSQTQLFLEECQAQTIAVTGTKGKGTTASFIEYSLKAGKNKGEFEGEVYIAGNIGASALGLLEKVTEKDWVILELSSFQLQDMTVSPHIAVVLNITLDHLDYHKDEAEYHQAKENIVAHQSENDYAILFRDSDVTTNFAHKTKAQVYYYSRVQPVEQGAFIEGENIVLRRPEFNDTIIGTRYDVKLTGEFNLENVTAAVTAAALAGASEDAIHEGISTFTGLHHRLEFVAEKNGVKYYDDSIATLPDAAMAAINSFMSSITLILGGASKGLAYDELIRAISNSTVTNVICIGQEGKKMKQMLESSGAEATIIDGADTMPNIVKQAAEVAKPGGVVLLSPSAASFDMFKSYVDRGDQFQAAVNALGGGVA